IADVVREAIRWHHPADRADRVARQTIETILAAVEEELIPPDSDVATLVRRRGESLLANASV
ncbi:MAG TPA: hypothetical protein VFY69_04545, partial [Solirubrobacterales bacterium]|nr:hypothetical protein [Solirubrobacterales bacterium]